MENSVKGADTGFEVNPGKAQKTPENCSLDRKQCKEDCRHSTNLKLEKRKGLIARFLERLAKENKQSFGGSPPRCH